MDTGSVEDKARRKAAILAGLEDQLTSSETPEVEEQLERLLSLGYSEDDAKEMMATILTFYIYHTQKGEAYTYDDYIKELSSLPDIDWDQ